VNLTSGSQFLPTCFSTFLAQGGVLNPKLVFKGVYFYRVKKVGLVVVRGLTDDFYHLVPNREGDVDDFIMSHLGRGSVFVDVGANVGYYTLVASKLLGSHGRVYAIEPVPSTAIILKANIKLNDCQNVLVYDVAAWSSEGEVTLEIPKSAYGYASAVRGGNEGRKVTVKATTLDEILQDVTSVDLVKIDVEGAEHEVLIGAKKSMDKIKYIVIELTRNIEEVLRLLTSHGFKSKRARLPAHVIAYRGR
jgi:FkbM family methyltransferase